MGKPIEAIYQRNFILDGSYELNASLRHSKHSVVYKARCLPTVPIRQYLQNKVALKLVLHESAREAIREVRREAKLLTPLKSDKIIQLLDYVTRDDLCFLVYELATNGDLQELLSQQESTLPLERCFKFSLQLLEALIYLEEHSIVHRDIKPSNILLFDDEQIKLGDFGIAQVAKKDGVISGDVGGLGTLEYLSPEQLQFGVSSHSSDLYAAAVTIFEIFTGHRPIESISLAEGISARLNEDFSNISDYRSDCSPELERVITKAMAVEPGMRYQSAKEFYQALKEVQEDLSQNPIVVNSGEADLNIVHEAEFSSWKKQAFAATIFACVVSLLFLLELAPGVVFAQKSVSTKQSKVDGYEQKFSLLTISQHLGEKPYFAVADKFDNQLSMLQLTTIPSQNGIRVLFSYEDEAREVTYRFGQQHFVEISNKVYHFEFAKELDSNDIFIEVTNDEGVEKIKLHSNSSRQI